MNSIPIQPDTTASIHRRRPVLSVRNLLVAGAAATLAAVAITPQRSPLVQAAAVEAAAPWWADPAQHPGNQDLPLSANEGAIAPSLWWADPAHHPANQDLLRAANPAGVAPTNWSAERR